MSPDCFIYTLKHLFHVFIQHFFDVLSLFVLLMMLLIPILVRFCKHLNFILSELISWMYNLWRYRSEHIMHNHWSMCSIILSELYFKHELVRHFCPLTNLLNSHPLISFLNGYKLPHLFFSISKIICN